MTVAAARLPHPARTTWRRRSAQAGLTLIETVVALAVISIGVVGIAYGFSAVVRSAGDAQDQAVLDGAVQTAADYVQAGLGYCPCDDSNCSAGQYSLNGLTLGNGVVASPIRQRDVQESTTGNPGYVVASCSNGQFDYGVQEITITVSKGPASVSRVVWKGDLP
jgi:prepilin-type N-terminal cleavage/methylation domain-containing protein